MSSIEFTCLFSETFSDSDFSEYLSQSLLNLLYPFFLSLVFFFPILPWCLYVDNIALAVESLIPRSTAAYLMVVYLESTIEMKFSLTSYDI